MATVLKRASSPFWWVVWWQDGKQRWRSTKTEDRDLADGVRREVEALVAGQRRERKIRGILELAGRVALPPSRVPVAALVELWKKQPHPRRMTDRTEREKVATLTAWVEWMREYRPEVQYLGEVSEADAAAYLAHLAWQGRSGQTRNNRLSMLHSAWQELRAPARLSGNPWEAVPRVEPGTVRQRAFTLEQVRELFASARARPGRVHGFWPAAVALGFHTGLRFGDICTLEWRELDVDEHQIRLVPNKGWKYGKELVLPLPDEVVELLPERGSGEVWPTAADAYRRAAGWLYDELRGLFRKAGIVTREGGKKVAGFHSLRHTYVTLLEDAGLDRETIRDLVGHGSPAMTAHYSHSHAAAKKAAGKTPRLV